jgi:pimeloyl-ACP methyl ester carboxylesterase
MWLALGGVVLAAVIPLGVHLGFRAPRLREVQTPADFGLSFEAVRIPTVRGRSLFGWWLAAPPCARTVVVLHGWGSNAEMMLPIAAPLRRAGLNVLLVDARNHGQSDGDTFSSLPRFAEDLGSAIAWLRREHPLGAVKIAALGHSVGAGAVLLEASRSNAISAVISIAAFADPAVVTERYVRHLRLPRWVVRLVIRYTEWLIGFRFEHIAPANTICRVRCPVLLVHGKADRTVPVDDARLIINGCPLPHLRLLEIEGADHGSTEEVERHIGALLRFLDDAWVTDRKRPRAMETAV